jgi:hypothetical protein
VDREPHRHGERMSWDGKIKFERGKKFDIQLDDALVNERRLADIFANAHIEKIELKSESWQWEQTGNICIEYRSRGQPSGIAATEATCWVHQLKRDGKTLCWLMFTHERLLELARQAYREGRFREKAGDDGAQCVVLLRLRDILR